jgi:plastocyanin
MAMKSMKSKSNMRGAVVLALLALAALTGSRRSAAAEKPPHAEITIDNFSFGPQSLSVKAGAEVTWVNHDDIPHTIVSEDLITFRSRVLDTDESWSFTFTKPGTYTYFCSIHPKMTAKIVVQ